jgi:acetyl-CoA carboxylase biotin carboxyl carrier protein
MNLTNEDVEEIVKLLDSSFYDELHLKTSKFDLRLRRSGSGWTQEVVTEGAVVPVEATKPAAASDDVAGLVSVRAAMVGTFYRAPKPGAPPFVDIGADVTEHTVIGIIETMKLMNAISAGASGRVIEILAPNGEIVEVGQVLMRLSA